MTNLVLWQQQVVLTPAALANAPVICVRITIWGNAALVYSILGGNPMYDFTLSSEFERMYEDYFSKIYNYVFYRILHKENAEDLVSQIFLKVSQNIFQYDETKASFRTWIYKITDNILIDFYRKNKKMLSIDDEENGLENILSISFEEQYQKIIAPDRKELYRALCELTEMQRELIALKYFFGYNNREISQKVGMNESTVSTRILRGVSELKKILNTHC
jgi:RNA polymerase sigma-70 factor (ECF subfamily)